MTDKKLRLYTPLFLLLFILLFIYGMFIHNVIIAVQSVVICLFYAIGASETSRWVVLASRKKQPGLKATNKRLLLILKKAILPLLLIPLGAEILSYAIGYSDISQFQLLPRVWDYIFMIGLHTLCSLVVIALYEGLYYVESWKVLFAESERMKKANLNSQYQFLKDQVKPHFLFNSLNTLTSLIGTDPERAEQFVVEMSAVYRYLLTKKEKELATLRDELHFLDSYILMLKTRFADSLEVDVQIDPAYYELLLPPFVLQLLVENAVKHNIVSREKPLYVSIKSDGDQNLIIVNNIQRKSKPEPSEKTGLTNPITRYQLLKKEDGLSITDANGVFKIVLPLVQTNMYETADLQTSGLSATV